MSFSKPKPSDTISVMKLKQFAREFGEHAIGYLIEGYTLDEARLCAEKDGCSGKYRMTARERGAYQLANFKGKPKS